MDSDAQHLQLLSIFHYVVGGLATLFSLFPIMYIVMGIAIITGELDHFGNSHNGGVDRIPPIFGWMVVFFGLFAVVIGITLALCIVMAGRKLARRSSYTYCLVIASIECMFMPFGTVLGVFTIIVLLRPSVKELFSQAGSPAVR